jgi:hypothetical protein
VDPTLALWFARRGLLGSVPVVGEDSPPGQTESWPVEPDGFGTIPVGEDTAETSNLGPALPPLPSNAAVDRLFADLGDDGSSEAAMDSLTVFRIG